MKEFTKSVASAGLAGLLFSARQMTNVITQPPRNGDSDNATRSMNALAQAAADQCGESLRETFHALDRIQREAINTGFRFLSLDAFSSHGATESFSGFARQTTDQVRRWIGEQRRDCGCDGPQNANGPFSDNATSDP